MHGDTAKPFSLKAGIFQIIEIERYDQAGDTVWNTEMV